MLLRTFLNLNGYDMSFSEDEIFELAVGVAEHKLTVDAVEGRLRTALFAV